MTEIERIIKDSYLVSWCPDEETGERTKDLAKSIEQYVQEQREKIRDSVVEQANVQLEQEVIKARIEELENMADDASEYYNQKRCERIAQLKQSLTQEE